MNPMTHGDRKKERMGSEGILNTRTGKLALVRAAPSRLVIRRVF
jgi:hypothetical protein